MEERNFVPETVDSFAITAKHGKTFDEVCETYAELYKQYELVSEAMFAKLEISVGWYSSAEELGEEINSAVDRIVDFRKRVECDSGKSDSEDIGISDDGSSDIFITVNKGDKMVNISL